MPLLEIGHLTKAFGGLLAVDDVSLSVERGEIVSVIGPNGAGKTTFFNLITGLIQPDEGSVVLDGEDIVGFDPNRILARGLARTFQTVRLFPEMTVRENVMVGRHARTSSGVFAAVLRTPRFRAEEQETRDKAEEALGFFGSRLVGYRLDQPAAVLSYANRRRLEMARAMATEPHLILLDEPTAGMNPSETKELTDLIGRMRDDKGLTVLVIEHDMQVVRGVSDRVTVLDYGRKIAEGTYEVVSSSEEVIEAYLGRKADE
jgi:branched-chain amino acid transport system ATP-binding protein